MKGKVLLPPISETIDGIVKLNEGISNFWRNAHGWAPKDAAELLSQARLDRQVGLSLSLHRFVNKATRDEEDGLLILGWVCLRALTEGTMKFFLCVHYRDFKNTRCVSPVYKPHDRRELADPDDLMIETLKQFYCKHIWTAPGDERWLKFVNLVQYRGNAIHAYRDRELGTRRELRDGIRTYFDFLNDVHDCLPYPENSYEYTYG